MVTIRRHTSNAPAIAEAAAILARGGLVVFPTETVYGLGADASNADAVAKVFETKGRPSDNPLIVHIAEMAQLTAFAAPGARASVKSLAGKFWPGPLTLVIRHNGSLPKSVTAGLPTVAVRMPDHPVALALIKRFGRGIVGPSANLSGRPSPTTAQHVMHDLGNRVDMILDAGPARIGIESTVLDITTDPPSILRLGGLSSERLEEILGPIAKASLEQFQRSPGTRHRHYAPRARVVILAQGKPLAGIQATSEPAALIYHSEISARMLAKKGLVAVQTPVNDYARTLFDALRRLDESGVEVIYVEAIPEEGIGEAVMDRLRRAAER
jgi:L-threonylcarbamoyladenylate synthase